MKPFSAFYDHLLPELPGCTTAFLDLHLLQVAREFCQRTACWRDTFPTITPITATLTYILITAEAKADLVRVLRLTIGDQLSWCSADPAADEEQPQHPVDQPPFTIAGDNEQITFEEQPEGDIVIVGAMRPMLTATTLPDLLRDDYLEAMRAGVLSRLMAMGKKRWTDRDLAAYYADIYAKKTMAAAVKAQGGNTRKPLRTRQWG